MVWYHETMGAHLCKIFGLEEFLYNNLVAAFGPVGFLQRVASRTLPSASRPGKSMSGAPPSPILK